LAEVTPWAKQVQIKPLRGLLESVDAGVSEILLAEEGLRERWTERESVKDQKTLGGKRRRRRTKEERRGNRALESSSHPKTRPANRLLQAPPFLPSRGWPAQIVVLISLFLSVSFPTLVGLFPLFPATPLHQHLIFHLVYRFKTQSSIPQPSEQANFNDTHLLYSTRNTHFRNSLRYTH
jgi:hypothetical protein